MSRFWEIACVPMLFGRHVCLSNLKHAPSSKLPLTADKTVFSHLNTGFTVRLHQSHQFSDYLSGATLAHSHLTSETMLSNRSSLPLCQVSMFSTSPMSTKCDRALLLCEHSLRASSPIWASEASLARTRERGASPLARAFSKNSSKNSSKLRGSLFVASRWPSSSGQTNSQVHHSQVSVGFFVLFSLKPLDDTTGEVIVIWGLGSCALA